MRKILLRGGIVLVLILVVWLGGHYVTSYNVSNEEKLIKFILHNDKPKQVQILKQQHEEEFFAILYNSGSRDTLIILEQDNIFKRRYRYFGGGNSSQDISSYNFNECGTWNLIIVYGNNAYLKGESYDFINNNKLYKKDSLGNYILDIYKIQNTNDLSCDGNIYDKNKNIIGHF